MNNLQITARFQIHHGQLSAFQKLAEECLAIVQAKDKATLQYDWYFDHAQTECVIRETYPDSDALLTHLSNLGEVFGKLLALGDFSAEVYGQPSAELLQATSGLKLKVYTFYQGV
jgi:quinol monooxygenase YgiN